MSYRIEEQQTAADVAGEIVMLRSRFEHKTMMLVEGGSDKKFFQDKVGKSICEIVISFGKANAIVALNLAAGRGLKGVLAIVDRDYDDFIGEDVSSSNVVVTDHHDTEMMMIQSPALNKIIAELGSQDKIMRLEDSGVTIRDFLLGKFIGIGLLRLYSLKSEGNLKFRDYDYRHVDRRLAYSNEDMVRNIANYSGLPGYDIKPAVEFIESWDGSESQRWAVCCGHDAAAIIGKSLISVLGNRQASDVSRVKMEGYLRLGYERAYFFSTDVYRSIVLWEQNNEPFKVFDVSQQVI